MGLLDYLLGGDDSPSDSGRDWNRRDNRVDFEDQDSRE